MAWKFKQLGLVPGIIKTVVYFSVHITELLGMITGISIGMGGILDFL